MFVHLVFAYILRRFFWVCFTFFNRPFASCALSEASTNRVRNEISSLKGVPSLELTVCGWQWRLVSIWDGLIFRGELLVFGRVLPVQLGVFLDPTFLTKNQWFGVSTGEIYVKDLNFRFENCGICCNMCDLFSRTFATSWLNRGFNYEIRSYWYTANICQLGIKKCRPFTHMLRQKRLGTNSIQSQFEATCHWFLGSSIAKLGYHLPL